MVTPSFRPNHTKLIATAVALGAVILIGHHQATAQRDAAEKLAETPVVDTTGNMHVPQNYRTTYEFLGSWSVAADDGKGAKQIHVVYALPGTIAAFRKTGHFADGAVLVKEVFDAASKEMTTGHVSHQDKLEGWFVMVRDSKNEHTGNRLWGDGWGWSWFDAADPIKTTTTDYKANCQGCHVPARATDWIYTLGYPPLKQ